LRNGVSLFQFILKVQDLSLLKMYAQSWNVMLVIDWGRLQIFVEVLTFAPKCRNHLKTFFFQRRSNHMSSNMGRTLIHNHKVHCDHPISSKPMEYMNHSFAIK